MVVGGPLQGTFYRPYSSLHCVNIISVFKTHVADTSSVFGMVVGGPLQGTFSSRPYPTSHYINTIIVFRAQATAAVC